MRSFSRINQANLLLIIIIVTGAILRLYNLNWDEGHYLHPDERLYVNASNITLPKSIEEFLSPSSPLNPNMFYYGSLPLFIYKSIHTIFTPNASFLITSRFVSSLFSVLTIPIVFFIGELLFSRRVGLLAAFVFTFSVGSIQHAHFNTTESLLALLLSCITYLSIRIVTDRKHFLFVPLGFLVGMSFGTKIVGLTFGLIPFLAVIVILLKDKKTQLKTAFFFMCFLALTIVIGFLAAPYQFIDYEQFWREQSYMQRVILGSDKPVFTIIYEKTIPYIYQFTQIFPFSFGLLAFPLSLFGGFLIMKKIVRRKESKYLYLLIIIYPVIYFLWSGAWYAKFSRYYLLFFPFFAIWSAYALSKFRKLLVFFLLLFIAINGLLYLKVYMTPHTRVAASQWIYDNISPGKTILGEHWDDTLPMPLDSAKILPQYNLHQLEVYNPDTPEKVEKLAQGLAQGDYFVITSRRVYYSILRNKTTYPYTNRFYQLLFDEKLGYRLIKSFTNYPFFFSDDIADESFQSYDHPPVYIFKNEERFSSEHMERLILGQ